MNNDIHVLFVSASTADYKVLATLLAHDDAGRNVRLSAAPTAQGFYDALYSEQSFQIVVVDDRQSWSDWRGVVAAWTKSHPNALLALLVDADESRQHEGVLEEDVTAVYPRNSAGLLALIRLVSKVGAQDVGFSLRLDGEEADFEPHDVAAEDRERLAYAVSHDLQDPLQLARRYADMLDEDYQQQLGDSGSKVLGHLQFNLGRTQEMLDELLDYSRLQHARPDRKPVDFNELLDEVTALYKLKLEEVGGTVTRQHMLPTLVVDRRQFQRVFQNLIGNAIKFRSDKPLQITVRSQRVKNEWRIGVKDNGIGIAEGDTARIFGMFERGGAGQDQPGTGMGLAICKRIVQNHGGRIWVRSSPGSGSVFIFSVPQAEEPADLLMG